MKTKILLSVILISSCLTTWAWFPPSLTQEKIDQIRIGQTTEADLVQLFGAPTTRFVDLRHHITLDYLRSVPMSAVGYLPFNIGSFFGGLRVEAQELWVELTPDGRVLRYEMHSSLDTVKVRSQGVQRTSYAK